MSTSTKKTKKQLDREKNKKIKRAVEAVTAGYQGELFGLLGEAERVEYNGAEIYIVNKEQFTGLVGMEKEGSKQMEIFDLAEKDADFSNRAVNILNKDRKHHAISYRYYMRVTPLILTDEEKVIKRVQAEIGIWANLQKKGLREALESGVFSEKEASMMRSETEENIETETKKLREIIENFDDYEVIVTNYESATAYPTIYYTDTEGKKHVEHLSIKKPNVLWHEEIVSTKGKRGDAKIAQFVKSANKVANMVYFKPKKKQ